MSQENNDTKTCLILTGGTMGMRKNDAGTKELTGELLRPIAKELGFENFAEPPYLIDSINFNINEHYPALRNTVIEALKKGETPVICGGTDTLVWYSSLLTKDMQRRGYLQPDSNQKIIFLSSMHTVEENPELVKRILRTGKLMAQQQLSGGFAVAADSPDGQLFSVHDVLNNFDKISHSMFSSLRSSMRVGRIINNHFHLNDKYHAPEAMKPTKEETFSRIAPPLLRGQGDAVLSYMNMIADAAPPFDGVLIEGIPEVGEADIAFHEGLAEAIRRLGKQGTRVVFCNSVRYNAKEDTMLTFADSMDWAGDAHRKKLEAAGATFVSGIPKDVYLDMMLASPTAKPRDSSTRAAQSLRKRKQDIIGIRYVPNSTIMHDTLEAVAPRTNHIVFSALPNNEMPEMMASNGLDKFKDNTRYWSTFEYNGDKCVDFDGSSILINPTEVEYAAAEAVRGRVAPLPGRPTMVAALTTIRSNGNTHTPKGNGHPSSGSSGHNL